MERRIKGLRFNYEISGREDGPWIVFSNSLMTNLSVWEAQMPAFEPTHRILRYDQRGHGSTEVPPTPCTFDALADDAAALMEACGIDRGVFVGVSMGGVTSLRLATKYPERLTKAVVVDGQWMSAPGAVDLWEERIRVAAGEGMGALVGPTVQRWFTPEFVQANPPVLTRIRAMIRDTPPLGFTACARALQGFDLRADAASIRVPTLLVAGAADGALPAVMREMQRAIAGSTFVEIPAAGHLPNVERPDAFNAALTAFVNS